MNSTSRSAMPFPRLLFDNNVMRLVTAAGSFDKYDRLFRLMTRIQPRADSSEFVYSARSVMEFVGITPPRTTSIQASEELERQIIGHPALDPEGVIRPDSSSEARADVAELADRLYVDLYDRLYAFFQARPELSQSNFIAKLEEHLTYVDPRVREVVVRPNFEAAIHRDDFEHAVWNALALDRVFFYNPPARIRRFIHAAAQLWFSDFLRDGNNIPLGRIGQTIWGNFADLISRRTTEGVISGPLPADRILQNIRIAQNLCRMDTIGDLVDYELIHYAVAGRIEGRRVVPVLGFTTDNIDQIRMRVALYKSFMRHIHEIGLRP